MNCKTLLIAAAASASILGFSGLASAQAFYEPPMTPHIQSDGGHSGRFVPGRERLARPYVAPFVATPRYNGYWYYGY